MSGKEDRLNPELLTFKELQYSEADKRWYAKIHEIRSECGAFIQLTDGASGVTTGNLSTQLSDTRKMGGILTGKATLTSAGIKFLLKEILVSASGALHDLEVGVWDGGVQKLGVTISSAGVRHITDLKGCVFSSTCWVKADKAAVAVSVHVGGYRLALSV